MSDTLGSLRAEVLLWLRGDLTAQPDQALINSAINDALENIWMSMMQVQLARFFGSDAPITFILGAGQQRVQLVTITDPSVVLVPTQAAGGVLGARTYTMSYTYVTESGAETNPGQSVQLVVNPNNLAQIPAPPEPASGAFGWNLYVGQQNQGLQNQQPLPFNFTYNEPATGFVDYPDAQQTPPTSNQTADNISYITHMEITQTDTTLTAWDEVDIDSQVMRRLASSIASASEYQTYAWDLINGRTIEVRPPAGLTFNPRFFYVAKPRRMRYDQAELPYANIAGVHEFITAQAVGALKLAMDEYLAAEAWDSKAEKVRMNVLLALSQENFKSNTRIKRYL